MPVARSARRLFALLTAITVVAAGLLLAPASAAPEGVAVPAGPAGHLVTWGNSDNGLDTIPASIADSPVVAASGGVFNSIALTADGRVAAWGADGYGQATVPDSVADSTVTAVAAGDTFNVVLTDEGDLIAWGNNDYGQTTLVPTAPQGETFTAIAAGGYHGLALTDAGNVVGWGLNGSGQATPPGEIQGHTVAIAAGSGFSLALTDSGHVVAWGSNNNDQTAVPAEVDAANIVSIAAGDYHALALTDDGKVFAWGRSDDGAITLPSSLDDATVAAIAAGSRFSMALTDEGRVIAWGQGVSGQTTVPASLADATVTTIAAGASHALAIVDAVVSSSDPTVSGTPAFGQTLTATPGDYDTTPDSLAYQWYADGSPIDGATGTTYVPGAAQVGTNITVGVTATKAGYLADTDVSAPVGPVSAPAGPDAPSQFTTGPTATIGGTSQVGQVLTAGTGSPVPTPDSFSYAWFADGAPIAGADDPTYTLTSADVGHQLTVQVTAVKAGYVSKSDVSAPTAAVAAVTAPTLSLTSDAKTLRRGDSATLTWTSTDADSLTPGGDWPSTGTLPPAGTVTVTPIALGTHTYTLTATNDGGTATTEVVLTVVREATHLVVTIPGHRHPGGYFRIRATTLDAGEAYTVRFGSKVIARGVADAQGRVHRRVRVPFSAMTGRYEVRVTGARPDRTGSATIKVRRPR